MPHDHQHVLADWHAADPEHVHEAIAASKAAAREWASWRWEDRAAIFLRAAELLTTTWRQTLNAATMLGQSKTVFQAEIDAATVKQAVAAVEAITSPASDQRGPAQYRTKMAGVMLARALARAKARARP